MSASFAIAAMLILLIGVQLFKSETSILESNILESSLKDKTTVASANILVPAENKTLANAAIATNAIIKNKTENKNKNQKENQNENQTVLASTNNTNNAINTNIVSNSSSQAIRENDSQNIVAAKFNEAQISSNLMETMPNEEEKAVTVISTTYKEIDTEEEGRTINIGMLEIDGAAFRGITRRVSALLKRNKIEKEK
jgi:hypothetical protein